MGAQGQIRFYELMILVFRYLYVTLEKPIYLTRNREILHTCIYRSQQEMCDVIPGLNNLHFRLDGFPFSEELCTIEFNLFESGILSRRESIDEYHRICVDPADEAHIIETFRARWSGQSFLEARFVEFAQALREIIKTEEEIEKLIQSKQIAE